MGVGVTAVGRTLQLEQKPPKVTVEASVCASRVSPLLPDTTQCWWNTQTDPVIEHSVLALVTLEIEIEKKKLHSNNIKKLTLSDPS